MTTYTEKNFIYSYQGPISDYHENVGNWNNGNWSISKKNYFDIEKSQEQKDFEEKATDDFCKCFCGIIYYFIYYLIYSIIYILGYLGFCPCSESNPICFEEPGFFCNFGCPRICFSLWMLCLIILGAFIIFIIIYYIFIFSS